LVLSEAEDYRTLVDAMAPVTTTQAASTSAAAAAAAATPAHDAQHLQITERRRRVERIVDAMIPTAATLLVEPQPAELALLDAVSTCA
jgi:hypothetical protein